MKQKAKLITLFLVSSLVFYFFSCTQRQNLGSEENPVKILFVPSVDAKVLESNSSKFKDYLEKVTPYKFQITIPQSFIAVVESFGTKRADVAGINTFGYMLAREKYGVEVKLSTIRNGSSTYQSMIVVRQDSEIKKLEDLKDKKIAFVDASSTSGYLLPLKMLKERNIKPKETAFAMKHDSVISMVYQGQVDAGAAFYSPPSKNENSEEMIEDARRLVLTQYPDVVSQVRILALSEPIPNDPIVFRKDMPDEMKNAIVEAYLSFLKTEDGKLAFKEIYGVTELIKSSDEEYEPVKQMMKILGK